MKKEIRITGKSGRIGKPCPVEGEYIPESEWKKDMPVKQHNRIVTKLTAEYFKKIKVLKDELSAYKVLLKDAE